MNEFLYRLLCGFLIGVGCILPGVSGGVMAVSFGLYQPMLEALTGLFRDLRKHLRLLLPLGIGGFIGLLVGAEGLAYALHRWEVPMLYLFLGFILGGVPALWHEAVQDGFQLRFLWALLPGLLLLTGMLTLGERAQAAILTPMQWLLSGGLYALGTVVPGLSASFLLIQLGWYQQTLLAFSRLMLPELLFFAAGFTAVLVPGLFLIQKLLKRWAGYANVCILGLLAASVIPAVPAPQQGWMLAVDLMMLGMGLIISLIMSRLKPVQP
ncbi:MAG: DUF368 domain-containing protein [Clostridia bacterium]|nr:DUF368 domain-containing protein [Clostridia bacterium]